MIGILSILIQTHILQDTSVSKTSADLHYKGVELIQISAKELVCICFLLDSLEDVLHG